MRKKSKTRNRNRKRAGLSSNGKLPKKRVGTYEFGEAEKWMREKVQGYNDEGTPVFVETLVPEAQEERRKLAETRFPPGKDKQQEIVNRWIEGGLAKRDLKNGIILLDMTEVRKLPGLAQAEIYHVEPAIKELEEKNIQKKVFHKGDFFKYVMLKKKFLSLPTKFLIHSKLSLARKQTIHSALISYVEKRLKHLEIIKDEQMTFERNKLDPDFDQIEGLVERIIDSPDSFAQEVSGKEEYAELKADHDEINMIFEYLK